MMKTPPELYCDKTRPRYGKRGKCRENEVKDNEVGVLENEAEVPESEASVGKMSSVGKMRSKDNEVGVQYWKNEVKVLELENEAEVLENEVEVLGK
jgi:hypothetical protein